MKYRSTTRTLPHLYGWHGITLDMFDHWVGQYVPQEGSLSFNTETKEFVFTFFDWGGVKPTTVHVDLSPQGFDFAAIANVRGTLVGSLMAAGIVAHSTALVHGVEHNPQNVPGAQDAVYRVIPLLDTEMQPLVGT